MRRYGVRDDQWARIQDLLWIGEHRGRRLAQGELDAAAVVDRPTSCGDRDRLAVLRLPQAGQRLGSHPL